MIMDGKKIAREKFSELEEKMKERVNPLSLAVVCVGKDPVSSVYVGKKEKELSKRGVVVSVYNYKKDIQEKRLKEEVRSLKENGIIVQLPLPESLQTREVLDSIKKEKDVDLLSSVSCGEFYTGTAKTTPPVVGAVSTLLEEYKVECKGKNVVLIGGGALVGKPLAIHFIKEEATVTVVNRYTKNLKLFTREADILVSGAGKPGLIRGDMVKEGSTVIDAGTSSSSGELKGDVDADSLKDKPSLFSPVPGGVGPLTVYHLANNLRLLENDNR